MPLARPFTPILWLCCGIVGGQLAVPWSAGWVFPAAAVTAAAAVVARSPRSGAARMVALAALAAALGHRQLDARLHPDLAPSHLAALAADRAVLRGTIVATPARRSSGQRLVLQVDGRRRGDRWIDTTGRVLLTVGETRREWQRGDRIAAEVRLRAPRNFGNPDEFDYEHFLARRGIYTSGYAAADDDWQRLPRAAALGWADSVRRHALATLEQVAPPHLQPIAAALLLGDGASVPEESRRRYARAGVSHVLSISGLHVALVAAGVYSICRWILARSERLLLTVNVPKLANLASLPPILAYAAIAGAGAATLRSTVMIALLLSGLLLDRPHHWPAAVAAAAATVCIWSPGAIFEASFQLSFAAVIAIVTGGRRLREIYDRWAERRLLRLTAPRRLAVERWLVLSQGISAMALVATAPLTLYHFQQLSLVGLVSNLLIVPVTGMAAVGVGLVAVLLNPLWPGLGGPLFALCCGFLAVGDAITTFFSGLPGADLQVPAPSVAEIATFYALLASPLIRIPRLRAAAVTVTMAVAALQLASWQVERRAEDELRLTFISVGQGDSTLIEFPGGPVMLVDGGGLSATFDVGERIIAPLLLRRKIRTVDTVVLTHPDYDHYGGLGFIAESFRVAEIWTNGSHGSGARYEQLLQSFAAAGSRSVPVQRGYTRAIGGVLVSILHPQQVGPDDGNDASVTLQLSFGAVRVLLTGDLEQSGELLLLRQHDDLRSTILKVPHHGSRTSSTTALLDAVQPRIAIASSGFRNRYNMPHPSVVERYEHRAIDLLRTDLDGAVEIRIARSGTVQVTKGRRWRRQTTFRINPPQTVDHQPNQSHAPRPSRLTPDLWSLVPALMRPSPLTPAANA